MQSKIRIYYQAKTKEKYRKFDRGSPNMVRMLTSTWFIGKKAVTGTLRHLATTAVRRRNGDIGVA
jgi:hypothetical protein